MLRRHVLPATLLSAAMAVAVAATAAPAGAADLPVSQSRGFFLSGAVGGTDLATVAALQNAIAVNTGGASVTSTNPLTAVVLGQALPIGQLNLPVPGGLTFGAVNQFAQANPDGSSVASSGAVADNGAIQTPSAGGTAGNATLDLQRLGSASGLPTQVAALGNVQLTAGALAGQANRNVFDPTGALGQPSGKYQIGTLQLTVTGPQALTGLFSSLTDAATALNSSLTTLLDAIPANPLVKVDVTLPDPSTLLSTLTTVSGPGFSADLKTGTLTLDLAALIAAGGSDINNLAPNTDLLQLVLDALPGIAQAISSAVIDQLKTGEAAFKTALAGTSVTATLNGASFPLTGSTVAALLPNLSTLTGPLDTALATLTGGLTNTLGAGLGQLGTGLKALLGLVANAQSTAADQTFTETALALSLLPSMGGATPTALQLNLGSASVGPGAPLPVATTPPTTTTPVSQPPTLANTGPFETMGSLALAAWAIAAGLALMVAANAARRSRLLHVGSHRS